MFKIFDFGQDMREAQMCQATASTPALHQQPRRTAEGHISGLRLIWSLGLSGFKCRQKARRGREAGKYPAAGPGTWVNTEHLSQSAGLPTITRTAVNNGAAN
ncbi:hypothetical protein J6590_077812 [Homalodisca vitripennis]|nr:hypothetical protein J6590_077812 [Homalodisca vitripennis]